MDKFDFLIKNLTIVERIGKETNKSSISVVVNGIYAAKTKFEALVPSFTYISNKIISFPRIIL